MVLCKGGCMVRNIGGLDRGVRLVVGVALVVYALTSPGDVWAWVGLLPLLTGAVGTCPAYLPFGVKTCNAQA